MLFELWDRFALVDVRTMRHFTATGKSHAMTCGFQCIEKVVGKCESLFQPCRRCGYVNQLSFVGTEQLPLVHLIALFIVLLRPLYETMNSICQTSRSRLRWCRCRCNGTEPRRQGITVLRPE